MSERRRFEVLNGELIPFKAVIPTARVGVLVTDLTGIASEVTIRFRDEASDGAVVTGLCPPQSLERYQAVVEEAKHPERGVVWEG